MGSVLGPCMLAGALHVRQGFMCGREGACWVILAAQRACRCDTCVAPKFWEPTAAGPAALPGRPASSHSCHLEGRRGIHQARAGVSVVACAAVLSAGTLTFLAPMAPPVLTQ